jgi:hypothetical protein
MKTEWWIALGQASAKRPAEAELLAALKALWQEVGRTGWQSSSPLGSERNRRAALLNAARAAITKAEAK